MKAAISFNPTFNPSAKTLDFSMLNGFNIKKLFAVINITQNKMIYAVGQQAFGYSNLVGSVLTLVFDTSTHNANDNLMVIYDDESIIQKTDDSSANLLLNEIQGLNQVIHSLVIAIQRSQPQVDVANRPMVRINAIDSALTLSTVSSLNTLAGGNTAGIPYSASIPDHIYSNIKVS